MIFFKNKKNNNNVEIIEKEYRNKVKISEFNQKRTFNATSNTLMNSNLVGAINRTYDSEINESIGSLRARSRMLSKNNSLLKNFLRMLESNVIGKDGFKLQVKGKNKDKLDSFHNKIIQEAFEDWSKKSNCDIAEKTSFRDMCAIIIKTIARDGEAIVKLIREEKSKNNKYGLKLQLLDIERLDTKLNVKLQNGNSIVMGVEKNEFGKHVAYYIKKYENIDSSVYSGIINSNVERISADDLIHLYINDAPEQTRGIPFSHSVLLELDDLDGFNAACLNAAKMGAASSIYLEQREYSNTMDNATYQNEDGDFVYEMSIGEIRKLPPGTTMKSFDGKYPSDAYQIYTKRLLQQIASGLNLSPIFLANETSDLNYSTARTIVKEEQNYYLMLQNFLIENFVSVIYVNFLEQALLNKSIFYFDNITMNKIVLDATQLDKFTSHHFIGRRWEEIDVQKGEIANSESFYNMRKPLSKILSEKGEDLTEIVLQYKQDLDIMKEILGDDYKLFLQFKNNNVSFQQQNNLETNQAHIDENPNQEKEDYDEDENLNDKEND